MAHGDTPRNRPVLSSTIRQALEAAPSPSPANPFVVLSQLPSSPFILKGTILLNSDFPVPEGDPGGVEDGWFYEIGATVTDDDPAKTNTGKSYSQFDGIYWANSTWNETGPSITIKADKVVGAIAGHFAGLDGTGNLTDSGYSLSTFALMSHVHAAADLISGVLDAARIPDLDAAKIISGTFGDALIPSLAAAKITSGTFDAARIPDLAGEKITTGTVAKARVEQPALTDVTDVDTAGATGDVLAKKGDGTFELITPSGGASGPDDWGTDPDMVLTEGADLRASDVPDLEVQTGRHRLWNKSTNAYFRNPKDVALTVTAANVGKQKVANVEIPITVDGVPIIHDGAEADVAGTLDVIRVNAVATSWFPKYAGRYVAIRLTDTSGAARDLSSIAYRYKVIAGTLVVKVYVAPDNGADAPNWASKTLIGTSPSHGAVEADYTLTLNGVLPASTPTWVIMDMNFSNNIDNWVKIVTDGAVLTDLANDLWFKKSTDGTTWANQGTTTYSMGDGARNSWFGENTQGMTSLAAAGVPAFPAVTADHKIIGTIGDPAGVTITNTTDEVVDSSPGGNSVLLTPAADQYRP